MLLTDEETAKVARAAWEAERDRSEQLHDALAQAVAWIEECGSDHEGRQYVLTEARAALKGIKVVGGIAAITLATGATDE